MDILKYLLEHPGIIAFSVFIVITIWVFVKYHRETKRSFVDGQTVNETKALDWVTCDKCGFIGVRNIKTRELEEVEGNQRETGQPILARINPLGDTEPRHEKFPECLVQLQDFTKQPFLPLFYMQLPRQCPQFVKWQKGFSPKEHKEIIDRQLRQQPTAQKERSAIPNTLKFPQPPELHISYQKHEFGVFNGEPIITVYAEYRPTGTMRIEAIELQLVGEHKPSLDWKVYEVKQDVWITSDNKFKVPDGISPGEHDVTLAAFANGEWWGSHPFTIVVNS